MKPSILLRTKFLIPLALFGLAITGGDPMWCPAGVAPVPAGGIQNPELLLHLDGARGIHQHAEHLSPGAAGKNDVPAQAQLSPIHREPGELRLALAQALRYGPRALR